MKLGQVEDEFQAWFYSEEQNHKVRLLQSLQSLLFATEPRGPSLYYVRLFFGFLEPPTHLRKDIFIT